MARIASWIIGSYMFALAEERTREGEDLPRRLVIELYRADCRLPRRSRFCAAVIGLVVRKHFTKAELR